MTGRQVVVQHALGVEGAVVQLQLLLALELRQPLGVGPRRIVDESILQQGGEHEKHAHLNAEGSRS